MEKPKCDVISFIVKHLNKQTFPVEVLVDICLEKFSQEDIIFTRNIVTDAFGEKIDLSKPRTTETKNIRQDVYKLLFYLRLVPFNENKIKDYTRAIEEKALLARLDGMSQLVNDLTGLMSGPSEKQANMQSQEPSPKPGPSNEGATSSLHASADQEMQPSSSFMNQNFHSYADRTPLGYTDDHMDIELEENEEKSDFIQEITQRKLELMRKNQAKLQENLERLPPPPVPLSDGLRVNTVESANDTLNLVSSIAPTLSIGTLRVNSPLVLDITSQPTVHVPWSHPPSAIATQPQRRTSGEPPRRYDFDALAQRAFNQLYRLETESSDSSSSDRNSSDNSSSDPSTSSGSSGLSSSDPVEDGLSSLSTDSNLTVSSVDSSLHEEAQVLLNSFPPTNGPRLIAPGVAAPRPAGHPVHEFIRPADLWGPPLAVNEFVLRDSAAAQPPSDDESSDSNISETQPSPKRRRPME